MTKEEAKKMLKAKLECFKNETSGINHDCNMRLCDGCSLNYEQGNMGEQKEALQMAIKALEQTELNPSYNGVKTELKSCEDYISRTELLVRIDEERKHLLDLKMDGAEHIIVHHARRIIEDMLSITPKALEQQPCEDCISREAVIDGIERYIEKAQSTGTKDDFISFQELVVKQLPSVTPQPNTGHWIDVEGLDSALWHNCSECGETEFYATDYCPNCGAKMEVEE